MKPFFLSLIILCFLSCGNKEYDKRLAETITRIENVSSKGDFMLMWINTATDYGVLKEIGDDHKRYFMEGDVILDSIGNDIKFLKETGEDKESFKAILDLYGKTKSFFENAKDVHRTPSAYSESVSANSRELKSEIEAFKIKYLE